MPGGNKRSYHGHTYLHKTAAFSCRFVEVCITFCYHQTLKVKCTLVFQQSQDFEWTLHTYVYFYFNFLIFFCFYRILTLMVAVLSRFNQKKNQNFLGFWHPGKSYSTPLTSSCHFTCLWHMFYVLDKTDVPIFFLYYPLAVHTVYLTPCNHCMLFTLCVFNTL